MGLPKRLVISEIDKKVATDIVVDFHYLHRRPPISFCYGLFCEHILRGAITFGVPASRNLQISVCPSDPDLVLELNRLWVDDLMPRNSESWFISRSLKMLPPRLVCSYADTSSGHVGYVYRGSNWFYHGYTDMERKTPRYDYCVPGKHSRDAFRGDAKYIRVRRRPKYKYWIATGNRRDRRRLQSICGWGKRSWNEVYPDPILLTNGGKVDSNE